MQKIHIIAIGSLKENYLKDACLEYKKRLNAYCRLDVVEISPVRISSNPSKAEIVSALELEAQNIQKRLPAGAYIISLCVEGQKMDSLEFAKKISSVSVNSVSDIYFVIGSSYGLSEKIKTCSKIKLSLSDMTFPHQLARVMLLEQIYRGYKILKGETYHK